MVELSAGESVALAIAHADPWEGPSPTLSDADVAEHLENTTEAWRTWSALHQSYDGPWADLVAHSGRVLQGLTHRRTGAIVAAATTSLPEVVGGSRNWDYRYAWVRDASFTSTRCGWRHARTRQCRSSNFSRPLLRRRS